jgi:hypothetical protein
MLTQAGGGELAEKVDVDLVAHVLDEVEAYAAAARGDSRARG